MSRTVEPVTIIFEAFDMHFFYCDDWIEINNGTGTQRYCGNSRGPGTVTGTTITVKLRTNSFSTRKGFFAVVTGDATVTTDITSESDQELVVIEVIEYNFSHHHNTFPSIHHHTTSGQHQHLHLRPGQQTNQDCRRPGD